MSVTYIPAEVEARCWRCDYVLTWTHSSRWGHPLCCHCAGCRRKHDWRTLNAVERRKP